MRVSAGTSTPTARRRRPFAELSPPDLGDSCSPFAEFIRHHEVPAPIRLIILLGLVPHVRPQMLDVLWIKNDASQRGFTEFGGAQVGAHGGFVPTGETAVFLLAGSDLAARFAAMRLFEGDQLLARQDVLHARGGRGLYACGR